MLSESEFKPRVAVIGGGPGGLFVAWQLQQLVTVPYVLTLFEASARLGGKVRTANFASAPVAYEAGAAELYDYSHMGPDPLKELVGSLGLRMQPLDGRTVVREGKLYRSAAEFAQAHGESTRLALAAFDARARAWASPEDYYGSDWSEDSEGDPLERCTFANELDRIHDEAARGYVETLVHSDVATEPHRTSAAYGLQNYLMNEPEYMRLYTIEGGIERLPQELAKALEAQIEFQARVERVERLPSGRLLLSARRGGAYFSHEYDYVVAALPVPHLLAIEWRGGELSVALRRHHAHFDQPAHYLRISILFREVFWRDSLRDSYMMLDAFGGCCLYDESARNGGTSHGLLGWLLAGEAAMRLANSSDAEIVERVLQSLPEAPDEGSSMVLEAKVHRWIGEVNGRPGGFPAWPVEARHMPDLSSPNLLLVGDYLFDSTLNGVFDSAEFVAQHLSEVLKRNAKAVEIAGAVT